MTELLFMSDNYVREFDATVTVANGTEIELDRTGFYPEGGGQPCDTGAIECSGRRYGVVMARKEGDRVLHVVDKEGLIAGDRVRCVIDWERKHALMRNHTAAHLLSALIHRATGALITGNQLGTGQSRIDFALETFDRAQIELFVSEANGLIAKGAEVKTYFITRSEADFDVTKLAAGIGDRDELRIIEIAGIDKQADGGTHVNDIREIGSIELVKTENKGKNNRRVYFRVGIRTS